ncbi:GMC family oxidoreductase N-terminal domain-containing protein [Rhodobacteraceae bacterium HSP-20]|uniref:GMC family oxidoreductase N-terminal domain-containing protein n=1 Tax=Paragemmobacter amnigenus TaxID=2852097 RepID=A0ABS6J9A6_9RHOB|nr:GMC family oxidoreductase N-terminal domain-containing protein [Rhodobacter amnigenus]MBU9699841.1 GMC family oxidoreductase N-terminal domain-containing protein [Rhodobacter amnigenus]MBV4391068.1 GMC family oxidoreductase N-terminal domain-containing protein [Rhodobacter amnigenus]
MTDETDYIIVGAGSAGCVLADRLTASGKHRVTVLEAGGTDRRFFVMLPLGYGKLFYDPAVNWLYKTEPDPGLAGARDHWPRGKVLGGSSSINAMVYIRGHRADYDEWAAAGNTGWGWDDVLAAYKAMEDTEAGGDAWRGKGGPLFVSANRKGLHPLVKDYIAACESAGLAHNPDFNGAEQEGTGIYQMTIKDARRNSAARAFLRPAMKRPNCRVITGAMVTRVLIENGRATGVEYRIGNETRTLRAKAEVILSGGAINSPQLLQLSGLGPGALLQGLGIPVLRDNPNVGDHLSDHQGINYTWKMRVPTYNDELRPWWGKLIAGMKYVLAGSGPLSKSINHGGGFFRTSPDLPRPNMQLYMQAFSTLIPRDGERPILTPDPFPGMSIGLSNCRPTSRGHICIASPDPFTHPTITANAFSTDHDVQEMLLAVKYLRHLAAQPPLARLIAEELRPGPDITTDEQIIDDFRRRSGTVYHPSCTCRMGPDPASSVIDARLRVHGVDGLRVIDASSFPNLIAGNTNAPAMMVGWKGAELVLADAR